MSKQSPIYTLVKRYITQAGAKKKRMLEEILEYPNAERRIYDVVYGENQRACLRVLADACKKKQSKLAIKPFVIRDIDKLLGITDDKARKTACMLIGTCAPNECADKLLNALRKEKIRFVRPSIILAIGNTDDPSKYLTDYAVEPGEPKHVREEGQALKKALSKAVNPTEVTQFNLPETVTITWVHREALISELKQNNIRYSTSQLKYAVDVPTKLTEKLRCYNEALYYIGQWDSLQVAARMLDMFGCKGLFYRIEAGCFAKEDRRSVIQKISDGLSSFGYMDNPSAYSFEVRVQSNGSLYAVFPQDERFSYRKQSIPASINPVTAACIMQICQTYMKDNASVLDPFCGSATMLIERDIYKKTGSMVGVDISPHAIKAACANRKASRKRFALIKGDILGYGGVKHDEIIANMPFGLRVLGHETNIELYQRFVEKMPLLLKKNGVAFLYTQEKALLKKVLKQTGVFTIVESHKIESGGLCPTLYILKRSNDNE